MIYSINIVVTAKKKKRYPGFLAHAVFGIFYSVIANQRQPLGGGGGGTQFVHGRSRMTIDARIPTMPGRSTSGFHQPGRHCLHQARSGRGGGIVVHGLGLSEHRPSHLYNEGGSWWRGGGGVVGVCGVVLVVTLVSGWW